MIKSSTSTVRQTAVRTTTLIAVLAGVLAAAMRWYFVTHAQVLQPLDVASGWGDAAEYYRYAWNLVHHGVFSSDVPGSLHPRPDSFRDPAYPAFLALVMSVTDNFDVWYGIVLLVQAVLGGMTVTCATLAFREAVPTWLLAVGSLLMAVWPHLVAIPAYVLTENLTAPLCAIAALALGEAARVRTMRYVIVGGVAMALAALTNAVLAPVVVPIAGVLAWKRVMSRRQVLILVLVVAAPLGAWSLRNATIPTTLSPSFRAEVNLVQGSWPTYHVASQLWARHDPVGIETIDAINLEIAALHADRLAGLKVIAGRMSRSPWTYLTWYASKPALLWGWEIGLGSGDIYVYPTRHSPFITQPVFRAIEAVTFVMNGVLALVALAGLVITCRRRPGSAAMLTFGITAAWVTVVYGVLQSDPRYSIPYRPGEIALACVAVAAALKVARTRFVGRRSGA